MKAANRGPNSAAISDEKLPSNLGEVEITDEVLVSGPSPRRARSVISLLAASIGLMMTGFGIIMPIFARRLGEFGSGVEALGLMTISFSLAWWWLAQGWQLPRSRRRTRLPNILEILAGNLVTSGRWLLNLPFGASS